MPTCKFCAEEISGNEIECPHCGSELRKPPKPKTESSGGGGKIAIIIIVVVVVLGGGGAAALFLLGGSGDDETSEAAVDQQEDAPAAVKAPEQPKPEPPTPAKEPSADEWAKKAEAAADLSKAMQAALDEVQQGALKFASVEGVPDLATDVEATDAQKDAANAENNKGMAAYKDKDYQAAIKHFTAALEHNAGAILPRYNLACTYALNGEAEKALDLLSQFATEADCEKCMKQVTKAMKDKDFDSVRDNPRYAKIVEAAE